MQSLLLKLIKKKTFQKFYDKYPKKISDIYSMVEKVKKYLNKNDKIF